ncbi:MAG TPA: C-terminal binding protein [Candidatus Saccharimonadales bacterium]|nr:C-terminal binding protein [Candidatus Saccharimonadales bacterium]
MSIKVIQVDPSPDLEPFAYEREALARAGGELVVGNCTTEDEVIERARNAEIFWVAWEPLVTRRVMEALPNCRLVVRWGVGYDQIPVRDATELGVAVANAPAYGTDDVAEHAIALLLSTARRVPWFHMGIMAGGYPDSTEFPMRRLKGKTLGVVGVGRIGSAAARRGIGLGLRVIGYDRYRPADELRAMGVEPMGFDELLGEADYVTLHVPLNDETRGLMSAERLAKLRPEAILVNTSRGPVIDEPALIEVLRARSITAAALDVFAREPLPADSLLRSLDNVILTPHAAGFSIEAWADLRADLCNTAAEWIRDGWSTRVVNPEVRSRLRPRRD